MIDVLERFHFNSSRIFENGHHATRIFVKSSPITDTYGVSKIPKYYDPIPKGS